MIRFVTAGESHGKCLTGILEGVPAGMVVDSRFVDLQLKRRQQGYGRGGRMMIEDDRIEITAGLRHGRTLGGPIAFLINNRDWSHWQIPMSPEPVEPSANIRSLTRPRPGHADLAGGLKFQTHDLRDILERASARETAARVAAGAFCRILLQRLQVAIGSQVIAIGEERMPDRDDDIPVEALTRLTSESPVGCIDPATSARMIEQIDAAKKQGDTLGGIVEVAAAGVPPGLGSHTQWDLKLDGRIAQALMSIPSVKAVEIGRGTAAAHSPGSAVHDEIFYSSTDRTFHRNTNRAGGLEGGITNGADVRARLYFKPIPTLRKPLRSIDVRTKEAFEAAFERSDACVVPAGAVIAEAMLGIVLAAACMEKFGGDSMAETEANCRNYLNLLAQY
jgi:chorismate synthase